MMHFFPLVKKHPFTAISLLLSLGALFLACNSGQQAGTQPAKDQEEATLVADTPLMRLLGAEETGLDFVNEVKETHENNPTNNINIYNGGGVAVADINNDSLPDLYFINCSGKNKLFLNLGHLKFKDITDGSGLESEDGFETSATAVDINADGWMDFYVGRSGPFSDSLCRNRLFINNGNLTFTERAAEYGLDLPTQTPGANFFDFDLDGDLDVYILNYPKNLEYANKLEARLDPKTQKYKPVLEPKTPFDSDRLYRNDGNGKFTDISKQAGIQNFSYGWSATVSDFNGDHYPDIYVGNDFIQPDNLYINNRNGTFTNQLDRYFSHTSNHTMGVDISDFDNDGLVDVIGLDMLPDKHQRQKMTMSTMSQSKRNSLEQHGYPDGEVRNVLQHNSGGGRFSDVACIAGVFKTDWSWSSLLFDIDNDGFKDLAITNGYRRDVTDLDFMNFTYADIRKTGNIRKHFPNIQDFLKLIPTYKSRNYVFRNRGDWTFENEAGKWLTMPPSWSNGAVYADFDRDGDLDWVVNNLEDKPFFYENLASSKPNGHFLEIKLFGAGKNTMAVGATATIHTGDQIQYQELNPSRGIFSSVEHILHFGLGSAGKVDKLVVRWPTGKTTTLTDVPANHILYLHETDANGHDTGAPPVATRLMQENTAASGIDFKHVENEYLDFDTYFLLPWQESDLGPLIAKGDVNGDGLEDFYIGNAFGQASALYIQTPDGRFRSASADTWKQDIAYEDHGALFFDADHDGDLDLLVISGGAEADPKFAGIAWQNRLYINMDGKGTFAKAANAFPQTQDLGERAVAYDYDQDGDLDLFVGGRVIPTQWPLAPRSYVWRNDGGHFTDVTAEVAPEFEHCGMVTDLVWANVDGDAQPELIVTGEWMPIMVFKLEQGKLKNRTAALGLGQSNGLWNRLVVSDLDGDGDLDILGGNFGLNTRLTASAQEPLRCYAKDFDGNGSIDPILAAFEDGKEYPLMRQDALLKQMPVLKKRFIYARDYARVTVDQIFPRKELESGQVVSAHTLATTWWENKGGSFVPHTLPIQAQLSPVYGMIVQDFNGDGLVDILLAGNKIGIEVETGRCDSGIGSLFLGDGHGSFRWMPNMLAGFWAPGDVRDLAALRGTGGRTTVVVANNNAPAQVFTLRQAKVVQ